MPYFEEQDQIDEKLEKSLRDYNITPIERQAAIFDRNVTNQLADTTFLGSGLKSEQAEIERHLIKMVKEGMYSYKYIQNFLMTMGYQPSKIKEVFRKITGINPNDLMDPKEYFESPSSIPGLTHAWGEGKKGKYDFYFINTYNNGYAVFGQKGDLERDIVELCVSLKQAMKELKKKVKQVVTYDNVIDEDILLGDKEIDRTELSGDVHIPVTANEDPITFYRKAYMEGQISEETLDNKLSNLLVENYANEHQINQVMQWKENYKTAKAASDSIKVIAEMKITRMFGGESTEFTIEPIYNLDTDGIEGYNVYEGDLKLNTIKNVNADKKPMSKAQIDEELFELLSHEKRLFASIDRMADTKDLLEQEGIDEKEKDVKKAPIENEISGRTPDDFFKKNIKEGKEIGNIDDIKEVLKTLNNSKEIINDFEVNVHSYEYYSLPSDTEDELRSRINSEDSDNFFSSNSVISIILEIKSKELGDEVQKKALAVFTSKDKNVNWDGIVKGEDNNFYAFTNEGISKMFEKEIRHLQEQKTEE